MNNDIKKFLEKMTNTRQLVIIFIIGIGLLLLPGLLTNHSKTETTAPSTKTTAVFNPSAYEKELEDRLSTILSTIRGVTNVSVMVTLEDSGEDFYARNEKTDEKNTTDGSLLEDTLQLDGTLALKNETGGGQSPVLLKTGMPRVSGVLVTAKGVDDMTVRTDVTNAVRAVLNVALHRVQVLEKA